MHSRKGFRKCYVYMKTILVLPGSVDASVLLRYSLNPLFNYGNSNRRDITIIPSIRRKSWLLPRQPLILLVQWNVRSLCCWSIWKLQSVFVHIKNKVRVLAPFEKFQTQSFYFNCLLFVILDSKKIYRKPCHPSPRQKVTGHCPSGVAPKCLWKNGFFFKSWSFTRFFNIIICKTLYNF